MKVNLFGIGVESQSRAITAQKRVNLYTELRQEGEKSRYVLIGRPGLVSFVSANTIGAQPSRGMWAVNTISTPLLFSVHGNTLYAINNAGAVSTIGTIGTSSGVVSMVDDGTYLMLVDGTDGWYYNMATAGALTQITDGNFCANPTTVTWQDTYFIVTDGATNQWQLSSNADPSTWPAVNIGFTGTAPGPLAAGIAATSIMNLFGDLYAEFWQDTGAPDFPYALIPGSGQDYGLAGRWSLTKFDNTLVGLFKNRMGGANVSRLAGYSLQRISTSDIDALLQPIVVTATARGYAFMANGHPFYVLNLPDADLTLVYDGASNIWSQFDSYGYDSFRGVHYATFLNRRLVSDRLTGAIWEFSESAYDDDGDELVRMVQSQHIWNDDKYIGISRIQVDFEQGVGLIVSQGSDPVVDLQVSKDGGNTFTSVGFSGLGRTGEYTWRSTWNSLGAARDWVLRLVISDPVKVVITGATAEMTGASF